MSKLLKSSWNTHYGISQNMVDMDKWATKVTESFNELFSQGGDYHDTFPIFIYTGMSGISAATALGMVCKALTDIPFAMMYVRKDGENSHGSAIEVYGMQHIGNKEPTFIFVDDFIDSGATVVRVFKKIQEAYEHQFDSEKVLCAFTSRDWSVMDLSQHISSQVSIDLAANWEELAPMREERAQRIAEHEARMKELGMLV